MKKPGKAKKKQRKSTENTWEIHPNLSGITVIENKLNSPTKRKTLQIVSKIISSIFKRYAPWETTLKGWKSKTGQILTKRKLMYYTNTNIRKRIYVRKYYKDKDIH